MLKFQSSLDQKIQIIKSENDKNEYELFQIESNNLMCLVINDLNSKKEDEKQVEEDGLMSSVSIVVNAGSFNDPKERPGLAHLLEHMIFMGSQKYPGENEFGDFISSNGGSTNAYTEFEYTNYQFSIKSNCLEKALDLQANLLANPLLSKDALHREIQAVNSEFEGHFSSDSVRGELIEKEHIEDKNHPIYQFGWGNMKSLYGNTTQSKETLWGDLNQFFINEYSADRMYIVVQTQISKSQSFDLIKEWVTKYFGAIENKNLGKQNFQNFNHNPYKNCMDEIIVFNSQKDKNKMMLYYYLPVDMKRRHNNSVYLINALFCQQGKGGVFQILKEKGLIININVYDNSSYISVTHQVYVEITLTDKGMRDYEKVLSIVSQYSNFLQVSLKDLLENNIQKFSLFEEVKRMNDISFHFYKTQEQLENAQEIADQMYVCGLDQSRWPYILKDVYQDNIIDAYDLQEIQNILIFIQELKNAKIIIYAKNIIDHFQSQSQMNVLTEKYMKTKYIKIPKPKLENKIDLNFELPGQNDLIPEKFVIYSQNKLNKNSHPKKIDLQNRQIEIYLMQDQVYQMPRVNINVICYIQDIINNPYKYALISIFIEIVLEKIQKVVGYQASMADISYSLKIHENLGLNFKFYGYSDKIIQFIQIFFQEFNHISNNGLNEDQIYILDTAVEKCLKHQKNQNVDIYERTNNNRLLLFLEHQFHGDLIAKEIQQNDWTHIFINSNQLSLHINQNILLKRALICGNWQEYEAIQFANILQNVFQLEGKNLQIDITSNIIELNHGQIIEWESKHDSAQQGTNEDDGDEDGGEHELNENMFQDGPHHQEVSDSEDSDGKKEDNSCIQIFFQALNSQTYNEDYIIFELLETIIDSQMFDKLRNKEQLGYYVNCSRRYMRGVPGLLFSIESSEYKPHHLQERIFWFIQDHLTYMTAENVQQFLEGLIQKKSESLKNITEEFDQLCSIMKQLNTFKTQDIPWNQNEIEIQYLKNQLSFQTVIETYQNVLLNEKIRKIAIFKTYPEKHQSLIKNDILEKQSKKENHEIEKLQYLNIKEHKKMFVYQ